MHIVVDERETALYEKLASITSSPTATAQPYHVTKRVLPLGDILIQADEVGVPAMIIERKTFADLLASIHDGRYDEQSHRLLHASQVHAHNIVYLIEGVMTQITCSKKRELIYATITSLNHYKGFSVYRTAGIQETAEWIACTAKKIQRNLDHKKSPAHSWTHPYPHADTQPPLTGGEAPPPTTVSSYCTVVKKVKKDNVTPQNIGEIILCQIPSVSSATAVAIMKEFKTVGRLIQEISRDAHCLDNIYMESGSGRRKISSGAVKHIVDYLTYSGEGGTETVA